ncbi:Brp/Blh family beta-carotene 15,15'-dioxygenase [Candidatus Pelagibacter sp.]|nr:Brp/Blh family beta-carotene 15,15'-dioxygenase [Candidatus Pelagibacter sp.]
MDLYKINKKYSFFLLLFNIIFLISISKYFENKQIEFQYQTIICFFLISIIGVSHGALDHLKGYKLMKIYKVENKSYFYLTYIAVSLIVIFTWMIVPEIVLIIFLMIASYHFGKEDSCVEKNTKSLIYDFLYLFKGSVIIFAPLLFHNKKTNEIFQILNLDLGFLSSNFLILVIFLSFIANIIITVQSNNGGFLIADWTNVILLNVFLSPLIAFTIYFCFLHSVRHSLSLIYEIDSNDFKVGFYKFIRKALPLTLMTLFLFIISLYFLANYYAFDDAILKVIFIGLASLTFPHILLEYLIEKNEK